jgi:Family of unknown function (DUF5995)
MDIAPPSGVAGVADALRAIVAGVPPKDGVGVFAGVYLTVTEGILAHLQAGDLFSDPEATSELDVLFAARFLKAVAAGDGASACWRPLMELREHAGIHPLQFALAGINAHVEHDLPLSVVDTCRRLGTTPEALRGNYEKINDVLAQVGQQVRVSLIGDDLPAADPLLHIIGSWSIDRARDAAWGSTLALWELRENTPAYEALAGLLDHSVGVACRLLLTPLG